MSETFLLERIETPTGPMLVATDEAGVLRAVEWYDHEDRMKRLLQRRYGKGAIALRETDEASAATRALHAYFGGELTAVDEIETKTNGTDFQKKVWAALRRIPAGTTTSYGALAKALDCPNAVRAVGLANGANPIPVIVPCHRVIGSNGSLTGFGGGLERKRWLLTHEGVLLS
jgi:methylated-DNA-[protein]-cysteine S-methyltransferase